MPNNPKTQDLVKVEDSASEPKGMLGPLLRKGREAKNLSQLQLSKDLSDLCSSTAISNFEKGRRRPSFQVLSGLGNRLGLDIELLDICSRHDETVDENLKGSPPHFRKDRIRLLDSLQKRANHLSRQSTIAAYAGTKTLMDFPHSGQTFVVVGDRRETEPRNLGDYGARSASPADDRWIYRLSLPTETEKVSDKEFILSNRQTLVEKYGKSNLLVIGSPKTNHCARLINPGAIFRYNFCLEHQMQQSLANVKNLISPEDNSNKDLLAEELAFQAKKDEMTKNHMELESLIGRFSDFGIIDPTYKGYVRGFSINRRLHAAEKRDIDYGIISVALNPWSEESDANNYAVIVSGFHHAGTVWALNWLAGGDPNLNQPHPLEQRPYGGVVLVEENLETEWQERIANSKCRWETEPYDAEDLTQSLDSIKDKGSSIMLIDPDKIFRCIQLVNHLSGKE